MVRKISKKIILLVVAMVFSGVCIESFSGTEKNMGNEWQISSTEITIGQGVFIRGTIERPSSQSQQKGRTPVTVKVNGNPVNKYPEQAITPRIYWRNTKKDQCKILVSLLFKPNRKNPDGFRNILLPFFEEEGKYTIQLVNTQNKKTLFENTIQVREQSSREQKAYKLFVKSKSVLSILSVLSKDSADEYKNFNKLAELVDKYPSTPWARYAKVVLGKAKMEKLKRRVVRSKEDEMERQKDMGALTSYFKTAAKQRLGPFTDKSKFYLAHCLGMKKKYNATYNVLKEAKETIAIKQVLPEVEKMLTELKRLRKREDK